jgi:hypothetical protein
MRVLKAFICASAIVWGTAAFAGGGRAYSGTVTVEPTGEPIAWSGSSAARDMSARAQGEQ